MVKVRQDAWSHEDDLLLAETVLRHVREGSTQLNAFDEVGDKLNRTSAACGFRWNAEVRNKYVTAIDLAKRQRKERKRTQAKQEKQISMHTFTKTVPSSTIEEPIQDEAISDEITIDSVLTFLKNLKRDYYASNQSKATLEHAEKENVRLKEELIQLDKKLKKTETQLSTMQEDYQTIIQIMDRARRMTVLQDERAFPSPSFRMDKNGNLEQIANPSN